jgi:tetratricopeptide (TPR) repeat protein
MVDPGPPVAVELAPAAPPAAAAKPAPAAKPKPAPAPPPVVVPEPVVEEPEEITLDFEEEEEAAPSVDLTVPEEEVAIDFGVEAPAEEVAEISFAEEPAAEEEFSFEPPAEEPAAEELSFEDSLLDMPVLEESAAIEAEALLSAEPAIEEELALVPEPALSIEEPALENPSLEEITFDEEPVVPPVEESPVAFEPSEEELGEVDFYIEQELYDEARTKLDALIAQFPESAAVLDRKGKLDLATAPPEIMAPPPKLAPQFSAKDIEDELLAAIPLDDEEIEVYPQAAAAPPAPIDEANLFAEEDDFFDLASELEGELMQEEESVSLADEEQSLEDIFREFKKGVEQQLDSEDYDTHYNLGIAYKEMGLIDEAIGEFQLASKDPKRMIECCSMLGLCFLEKGMPQLAVKWYKKGLEAPEITEDEHLGLLYDLGCAHLETGDIANAQKAFLEVYGVNTGYRDVIGKIKQIEEAKK